MFNSLHLSKKKYNIYMGSNLNTYISGYNDIIRALGLSGYDGLLVPNTSKSTISLSKDSSTQIVHNDQAVGNDYYDTNGVYYFNYGNIYNTLNRNIGGNSYSKGSYNILDEGRELGQLRGIDFKRYITEPPVFISSKERDAYSDYRKYITDVFIDPSFLSITPMGDIKENTNVGVVRSFDYLGSNNPNGETDTLLGKFGSVILTNIISNRYERRKEKNFPSITNINYYGKGRLDIEESYAIEPLDTAIGMSSDNGIPEFGIQGQYGFVGFFDSDVEYSYTSQLNNFSFFDRWGELSNGTISLTNSFAFNSIKKGAIAQIDSLGGNVTMTSNPTVDMSTFLLENLQMRGNVHGTDITTYFAKHNFDIGQNTAQNRYIIHTNGYDQNTEPRRQFHYAEIGKDNKYINNSSNNANLGINYGSYQVSESVGSYGKDLLNVTNNAFKSSKYKTIIGKFATQDAGETDKQSMFQSAVSREFGMSHGRNLLKVNNGKVDRSGGNGYDNPYCRVWTYHHQYSRLCDTIRPFTKYNDDGSCTISDIRNAQEISRYRNTKLSKKNGDLYLNRYRHELEESPGQKLLMSSSVLNANNGLVKITPTSDDTKLEYVVGAKKCMFSIENLAWKDVEKWNENNISEGQTGPLGGRIMWFPPYGLTFSENVQANWQATQFIGRGEQIYTYTDTIRGGNLSFLLLIDHPSIVNNWNNGPESNEDGTQDVDDVTSTEQQILRFFAGCEILAPFTPPQTLETPILQEEQPTEVVDTPIPPAEPVVEEQPHEPIKGNFSFIVYYPNNYSGVDDDAETAMSYLLNGILFGVDAENKYKLNYNILNDKYSDGKEEFRGGYEMNKDAPYGVSTPRYSKEKQFIVNNDKVQKSSNGYEYIISEDITISRISDNSSETYTFIAPYNRTSLTKSTNYQHSWGYRIDSIKFKQNLYTQDRKDKNIKYNNYMDYQSNIGSLTNNTQLGLNGLGYNNSKVQEKFSDLPWDKGGVYSFADVFAALMPDYETSYSLSSVINSDKVKEIRQFIEYGIASISIQGCASTQGNYIVSDMKKETNATKETANDRLSNNRRDTIKKWLESTDAIKNSLKNIEAEKLFILKDPIKRGTNSVGSVDEPEMKITRSAIVTIEYDESISLAIKDALNTEYTEISEEDETLAQTSTRQDDGASDGAEESSDTNQENGKKEANIRYDGEEYFFKNLEVDNPFLFHRIKDKIRYFDPAFHSITPEGFAARLTFLQQCTRQGNTYAASDGERTTASNLSFGRPPVCVLRVGDFYYSKIIIDSINISYENGNGIQWDLNPEGIGVMPMYAKIDLSFKFVGGSDLNGPINRLQNALSFNYYANTRVYDDRSDAVNYTAENGMVTPWKPILK